MKKLLLLITYNVSLIAFCAAQNPLVKQWDKRFGGNDDDWFYSMQQTSDGGYILGGRSLSNSNGDKTQDLWGMTFADYWIVKTDSMGNKLWDKDFGGTDGEAFTSLQQTSDGGYILGGKSWSEIGGNKTQALCGGAIDMDYWIVKTDSLGNKQWDKDFGGAVEDNFTILKQTNEGGYILGGYSRSGIGCDKTQNLWGGSGDQDFWIIKIDSSGNKQWDKDFGGTAFDQLYSLQQTADKGYILGGYSMSGISGDKTQPSWGGGDYWIIKIDSLGSKQWDKTFGGTGLDVLSSVQQTADKGYILSGGSGSGISGDKTQDTVGGTDYWIVKTDSLGNKQWDKDFGGAAGEGCYFLAQTSDGGYILSGDSRSDSSGDKSENNLGHGQTWIVKTDSSGNKQWDKTLRTNTSYYDQNGYAIQTKDGCYAIANFTEAGIGGDKTQASRGQSDYWLIKFCDTTSTTSITQLPDYPNTFSISPNPARESLVISSEYGEKNKTQLILFDVFGNELYRDMLRTPNYRLPVSSLSPGIYFLKAGNEVRKFVKE